MNNRQLISDYYRQHRGELLAYANSRLGGNQAEAEDLVQDTYARLLTTDRLLTPQTLPALVYTIGRNLITDYYRRRAFRYEYEHYLAHGDSGYYTMESGVFAADVVKQMERGLVRIPEDCRAFYRMHIVGGMRVSEISEATGEKYKTVENRLGQARRFMRSFLRAVV